MYDVIIVGGGPAGAVAGAQCERKGLDTLILEKEKFPREKPCGGALSLKARRLLSKIGISVPENLIKRDVYGLRIHKPDNSAFTMESEKPIAFFVFRKEFDNYLIKQATQKDACLIENSRVIDLERGNKKIEVSTDRGGTYAAKCVIGADGASSTIAKESGIRDGWKGERFGICLQNQSNLSKEILREKFRDKGFLEVYYGPVSGGYAWAFPKKKRLNIGIGGLQNRVDELGKKFERFCNNFSFLEQDRLDVSGQIIPAGGFDRQITSDGVVLVGDSAGFVDSFGGEGIYYSMKSSILAAQVISESIEEEEFPKNSDLQRYRISAWEEMGKDLKFSYIFSLLIHTRCNFLLSLLENDDKLQNHFLDIPRGKNTYDEFFKKFLTRCPISLFNMLS